jgi:hypothetical protein
VTGGFGLGFAVGAGFGAGEVSAAVVIPVSAAVDVGAT